MRLVLVRLVGDDSVADGERPEELHDRRPMRTRPVREVSGEVGRDESHLVVLEVAVLPPLLHPLQRGKTRRVRDTSAAADAGYVQRAVCTDVEHDSE